jgi:WD40 repeat protein/DNA-binding SARP family transcriptional activator
VLRHRPPGYELTVDPARVDLFRFEHLVTTARQLAAAGCVAGAASLLREALGLWREAPLADLADEPFARFEIPRLEEARTSALEERVAADLALGLHGELVAEVEALVARHPYRERLRALLMLALYRAGRQADALAAYQDARDALIEGLGLEPGRELRELEAAILVQDASLTPEAIPPITADQVAQVLTAVDGEAPAAHLVAMVLDESDGSARRAADALDQAIARRRAEWFSATVEAAGSTRAELARTRHVIADSVLERRRRSARRVPDRPAPPGAPPVDACPYRGLLPFEPEDAAWYFGREQLAADVLATVASASCTAVVGASGSGKSSLVRAGLLAPLRDDALPGSSAWPSLLVVPGSDPVHELAKALAPRCHAASAEHVRDRLLDEPDAIAGFVDRALDGAEPDAAVVLVVDQFEELFTVCRDDALRDRFLDVLVQGAGDPGARLRVVSAVRADYLGMLTAHPDFAAMAATDSILVGPMSASELQRAVELPAARAGLELEPGLVEQIFDEVGTEPGALPLMETALLETWRNRDGSTMTISGYERAGGVAGALAHLADDVYGHLTTEQQAIARGIFLRLAETGVGTDDVRRRAPLSELVEDDAQAAVLATLVERRLVVAGDTTAEVAHEAILREWPQLRTWLDEDREGRRLLRTLGIAANDWSEQARDPALLFRGSRLAAAVELDRLRPTDLNPLEREFVDSSRSAEQAELTVARRTSKRLRRLAVGLALLLVVALVGGVYALTQRSEAEENASRAALQAQRSDAARLAATAQSHAGSDLDLAALLAVEAHRLDPSEGTESALQHVLVSAPAGLERVIPFEPEARYAQPSPDGQLLYAPGTDGVIRVYSVADGRKVRTLDGPSPGAIAPLPTRDRTRIIAGSIEGTIRIWDAQSGEQVVEPLDTEADGPAYGVSDPTDPDGVYVAAFDGEVARWSVADPSHPRRTPLFQIAGPEPSATPYPALLFASADGGRLAVSRASAGSTSIWDVAAERLVAQVPGTTGGFDAEGRVVTQDGGRVVRWDAASGAQVSAIDTGVAETDGVPVGSPDGRFVAVVDAGTTRVRVLDAQDGSEIAAPITLHDRSPLASFLPDGRLLTVSSDRAAVFRIVEVPVPALARPFGNEFARIAFDRTGDRVVTVGSTRQVWDVGTGRPIGKTTHPRRDGEARRVAPVGGASVVWSRALGRAWFADADGRALAALPVVPDGDKDGVWWSPDGQRLVVLVDGAVSTWDTSDPSSPTKVRDLEVVGDTDADHSWATSVVFSDDGARTAVIRERAGVVTLFDTDTGRRRTVVRMAGGAASAAAFSPDGRTIAVTNWGDDATGGGVQFADVTTGKLTKRLELSYPPNSFGSVAYVRGGRALALVEVTRPANPDAGDSGTADLQLWDVASGRALGDPVHLDAVPVDLVASPDGSRLAHSFNWTLPPLVWDVSVASWAERACGLANRQLTRAEWERYLPGRTYDPGC